MLEVLLAALVKQQYNLRILHWKAVGLDFHTTHVEILDGYIDQFGDYIDKVAEMMIISGEEIPTSREIDEIAQKTGMNLAIKVQPYESEDIYRVIDRIFDDIMKILEKVNDPDKYPSFICSELDTIQYWFNIEGTYKNKQRLS